MNQFDAELTSHTFARAVVALKRHLLRDALDRKQRGERFAPWHRFTAVTQVPSAF
ncbi:hypothetical protein [Paraburkholderia sp. RL17-337-BIB-A]|uniref:hypothetical protein n=1 Tax=Paraburkholderia sp. RL17-337-BIB-A TaxID=3031636 RepID=UPI0038BC6AB8